MKPEEKISPAFETYLAEGSRNHTIDALVIYRTPEEDGDDAKSSGPRNNKQRQKKMAERARRRSDIEDKIFTSYDKSNKQPLRMSRLDKPTLPVVSMEVTSQTLKSLAKQPDVLAVMPNQEVQIIQPSRVSFSELKSRAKKSSLTWALEHLEIPILWEETQGQGVSIAVLDTGVYGDHPALMGRVQEFIIFDPLGRPIEAGPSFDSDLHGTHVCGTIAGGQTEDGVNIGVAPGADLLVAGVALGRATVHAVIEGIAWAVEKGADIINMSLGFEYYEPHFTYIFDRLIQDDILPVAAIGNESQGSSDSPGNAHNALSIGAIEQITRRRVEVASYSSGASMVFPSKQEHTIVTKPDLVAPGSQVYSCIPPENRPDGNFNYAFMDGTSMAAPHVSGVAALLMAAHPTVPVRELIQVLKETADHPKGEIYRPDNRWGFGQIRPVEALRSL